MKILLTGASGLVGTALQSSLKKEGHTMVTLTHSKINGEKTFFWDPLNGQIDLKALEGVEGVIHLAGENISSGRWTSQKMGLIRDSRVKGTTLLAESLAKISKKPKVFL